MIQSNYLLALLFFMMLSGQRVGAVTLEEVTGGLMCQCGCSMVLASCSHIECGSRDAFQQEIQTLLQKGESKKAILDRYVSAFGPSILASPPKEGFFLSVWVLPFIFLIGAGLFIVQWLLRTLASKREVAPHQTTSDVTRNVMDREEIIFDYQMGKLSQADYEKLLASASKSENQAT